MFYLLLTVSTVAIIVLAAMIWKKTRAVGFMIGIGFLYIWSLYGAWSIVVDGLGGNSGKHYHYLFQRLFVITLDDFYFKSIVLYALFIISVEVIVLWFAKPRSASVSQETAITISHSRVIVFSFGAGILSYLIIRPALSLAAAMHLSGYIVTRGPDASEFFSIHQVMNRAALVPLSLGFTTLCSGVKPRLIGGRGAGGMAAVLYLIGLVSMFIFCLILGNKNELFYSAVLSILFYLANCRKPRLFLLFGSGIAMFIALAIIDHTRGMTAADFINSFTKSDIGNSVQFLATSDEAFGAHFSMYGALKFEVPLTYGSSLVSLAASAIPRILWPSRPADIYLHYANYVGAAGGQGYSIHQATGWYLNFGTLGVFMGAFVWGWLWAALYNVSFAEKRGSLMRNLSCSLLFFTFTANIPNLVRAGPEGYKGVAVDAFLIPVGVLYLAVIRGRRGAMAQPGAKAPQRLGIH